MPPRLGSVTVPSLLRKSPDMAATAASVYLARCPDFILYGLTRTPVRERFRHYRRAGLEPVLLVDHRTDLLTAARVEERLAPLAVPQAFAGGNECPPASLASVAAFSKALTWAEDTDPDHPDPEWLALYARCRHLTRRWNHRQPG